MAMALVFLRTSLYLVVMAVMPLNIPHRAKGWYVVMPLSIPEKAMSVSFLDMVM
jgi:hypothetical protein